MRNLKFFCLFVLCGFLRAQTTLSGSVSISGQATIGGVGQQVVLSSITIAPPNPIIPYIASQTFTASGTNSDGSSAGDLTSLVTWASASLSVATMSSNVAQCVGRGTSTISASYQGITGTTLLTCQSPTFSPQGTFNVTQNASPVIIVQFTGANGSSPFTFSSSDLPGWLSLSNSQSGTTCSGSQINCLLVGTPATVGLYSFHIQATDNLGNTACNAPGCAEQVNVVSAGAEDNTYCAIQGGVETVVGLSQDGFAAPLQNCNYTAIAWTPTTTADVIYVCPSGQTGTNSTHCGGTTLGANPAYTECFNHNGTFPEWCPSVDDALLLAQHFSVCPDIQIFATSNASPSGTMNKFIEPNLMNYLPASINCGPDYSQNWLWIRPTTYASLPPPGNRITPAWAGQTSISGRPNYQQTTAFGVTPGIYMPMIQSEMASNGATVWLDAQDTHDSKTGTDLLLNGIRIMGIIVADPHGRDTSTDRWGNPVCPSVFGFTTCEPGSGNGIIQVGCPNGTCGEAPNPVTHTGERHFIIDRTLFVGCGDLTLATCAGEAQTGLQMAGGQHMSVIDSFFLHFTCLYSIGSCVDSHAVSGGNITNNSSDFGIKNVNNYIESSGETCGIWGGGTSTVGSDANDIEVRRNHCYKPLNWLVGSSLYPGTVFDAFIVNNKQGSGYLSGGTGNLPGCTIDPPINGTQAQCTAHATAGKIDNVYICPTAPCSSSSVAGSGYGLLPKGNGNTAPANPVLYFTDNNGVTYSSCQQQLAGTVNTNGTDVQWASGNKFVAGMVGTQLTITDNGGNSVNYLIDAFISKTELTIHTSAGVTNGYTYASNLASRGDCVRPMIAFFNIKNTFEYKHIVRALVEGNHFDRDWSGQSDQDGTAILLSARNANDNCPSCKITDVTFRYNLSSNTVKGMELGAAPATQGATLPQTVRNFAIHDNVFDGMCGSCWSAGTSTIQTAAGMFLQATNALSPANSLQGVLLDHISAIHTEKTGYSLTGGHFLNLVAVCNYASTNQNPSILQNFWATNTIAGGGVVSNSSHAQGCINCNTANCSDGVAGHGPTESALREYLTNSGLQPIVSSQYQSSQLLSVDLVNGYVTCGGAGDLAWVSGAQFTSALNGDTVYIQTVPSQTFTVTAYNSATDLTLSGTCTGTNVPWTSKKTNLAGGTCTVVPNSITVDGGGCSVKPTGSLSTSGTKVTNVWAVRPGAGCTSTPTITFHGGTCSVNPNAIAYVAGQGNGGTTAGCFDHNVMPISAWVGEIAMGPPWPTVQMDDQRYNACAYPQGGHNNTDINGNAITVSNWNSVGFVGLKVGQGYAADGSECNGLNGCDPPDLHLTNASNFHLAGNDGRDIGANMDLVIGKEDGTPSPYTGCFINTVNQTYQCPP